MGPLFRRCVNPLSLPHAPTWFVSREERDQQPGHRGNDLRRRHGVDPRTPAEGMMVMCSRCGRSRPQRDRGGGDGGAQFLPLQEPFAESSRRESGVRILAPYSKVWGRPPESVGPTPHLVVVLRLPRCSGHWPAGKNSKLGRPHAEKACWKQASPDRIG